MNSNSVAKLPRGPSKAPTITFVNGAVAPVNTLPVITAHTKDVASGRKIQECRRRHGHVVRVAIVPAGIGRAYPGEIGVGAEESGATAVLVEVDQRRGIEPVVGAGGLVYVRHPVGVEERSGQLRFSARRSVVEVWRIRRAIRRFGHLYDKTSVTANAGAARAGWNREQGDQSPGARGLVDPIPLAVGGAATFLVHQAEFVNPVRLHYKIKLAIIVVRSEINLRAPVVWLTQYHSQWEAPPPSSYTRRNL